MKKVFLVLWLFVIAMTLTWCSKDTEQWKNENLVYTTAQQVCLDNGWKLTTDSEWKDICLLWDRWIPLKDMEEKDETENERIDYLVLVNKENKLPEDWESKVELVEVQNAYDETIRVEKEALEKYNELRDALLAEWVDIELDSAYRSVEKQQQIWDEFEQEYGIDYTKTYVATPWYSEHHTALAIDICIIKDGVLIYENDDMIAEPEIFAKIHEKLADYGFILRYLEWKEDVTGYGYEPRHLRYVWNEFIAHSIMDNWLTLEEFYAKKDAVATEEWRLAQCEESVGFYLNFGSWKFTWKDEEESGASFVRNGHVIYEKWLEKWEADVQCFIDMVDWSINVEFTNHKPVEE